MTDEAMSPLRRRMIEDMTIRKLAPKTQQGYIRTIKDFAAFLGRSPDTASFEDVRRVSQVSRLICALIDFPCSPQGERIACAKERTRTCISIWAE